MSIATLKRHTFAHFTCPESQRLNPPLLSETVSALDQFFFNADVASYMVEGKLLQPAARAGYHTLRATAIGIQYVVLAVFTAIKYTALGFYHAASFCFVTAPKALFVSMPLAAQRHFFPTAAQRHEERVTQSQERIKGHIFTKDNILSSQQHRLTPAEQKALLESLLLQPVRRLPDYQENPLLKEFCELMLQIADADLPPDELQDKEKRALDIISIDFGTLADLDAKQTRTQATNQAHSQESLTEPKKKHPHLCLVANAFIEAFKHEREAEKSLTIEQMRNNPGLLLQYPHLLIRNDVTALLPQIPKQLRQQLYHKRIEMMQRALHYAHNKELRFLDTLPKVLKYIDLYTLSETFLSDEETSFLANRIAILESRLDALEEEDFEYKFLVFELYHLQQQQAKLEETRQSIEFLTKNQGDIRQIHLLQKNHARAIQECLLKRITTSLQNEAMLHPSLSERKAALEKKVLELSKETEDVDLSFDPRLEQTCLLLKELQKLEQDMVAIGGFQSSVIDSLQPTLSFYDARTSQMADVLDVLAWTAFNELSTPAARNEERRNNFARDVMCMLVETQPACHAPLRLAKRDARSQYDAKFKKDLPMTPSKGALKKIEQASEQFVASLSTQHLATVREKLFSLTEFKAQVQQGRDLDVVRDNEELGEKEKTELPRFKTLGLTLSYTEQLNIWYARLQDIWIEHMPHEQEDMLHAITNPRILRARMSECFEAWVERITGIKLKADLSFDHLTLPNHNAERKRVLAQLEKEVRHRLPALEAGKPSRVEDDVDIVRTAGMPALLAKTRTSLKTAKASAAPFIEAQGFDSILLATEPVEHPLLPANLGSRFHHDEDVEIQEFENIIRLLEQVCTDLGDPEPGQELEWKIDWIKRLDHLAHTTHCQSLRLIILEKCHEIISMCAERNMQVDVTIIAIFLRQHQISDMDNIDQFTQRLEHIHNFERSEFLKFLLTMMFAGRTGAIHLSSAEQISRLRQLCALSSLSPETVQRYLSQIQCTPGTRRTDFHTLLESASQALQASSLGLEGVDAEVVKKSFQISTLPSTPEIRDELDALMSRGSHALSLHLLDYAIKGKDLSHNQGREAIARALAHAYSFYPDEVTHYLNSKIAALRPANAAQLHLDPRSFAPPPYVFYCDLLRQLNPTQYFANPNDKEMIADFNLALTQSKDTNVLLMAHSRLIVDLAFTIQHEFPPKGRANADRQLLLVRLLLQSKIAYQHLRFTYFDGKKEIVDFLQIETDLAESAMVQINTILQTWLQEPDHQEAIRAAFVYTLKNDRSISAQLLKKEIKHASLDPNFAPTSIPGFFAINPGIVLDTLTGIVYKEGQRKTTLPPHLQNHPLTRSLNIHNFPYIWDPVQSAFIYFTTDERGRSLPQIIVKDVEGIPVIHKNLTTSFTDAHSVQTLQFVPREKVTLPIAALHRMGIQQFWHNAHQLFGYNDQGELLAIFDLTEQSMEIKETSYLFLTEERIDDCPVLALLRRNFNTNEILLSSNDPKTYFIPALGLTVQQQRLDDDQVQWVCERHGMEKRVLDLDPANFVLTLKFPVDPQKLKQAQRALKEALYRRELSQVEAASHLAKHTLKELDHAVAQCQSQLLALEDPIFLSTLPEDSYDTDTVKTLIWTLPRDIRDIVNDQIDANPALFIDANPALFEVFPIILDALCQQLGRIQSENTAIEEIEELLLHYQRVEALYRKTCDRSQEAVFFNQASDSTALTKDLTGALVRCINQLNKTDEEDLDYLSMIRELSKYSPQGPLSDSQLALLKKTILKTEELAATLDSPEIKQFQAYLQFMEYQHYLYQTRELAVVALADKQAYIQALEANFYRVEGLCQNWITELAALEPPLLSQDLLRLWRKTALQPDHVLLAERVPSRTAVEKATNPVCIRELQVISSVSVLDRINLKGALVSRYKDPQIELSSAQRDLSRAFQAHSKEQVAGFYFEKMGYFSLREFLAEFRITEQQPKGLYGLSKQDLEGIFKFLEQKKYIGRAGNPAAHLHRLTFAEVATTAFPLNELRSFLTQLSMTEKQLSQALERIQSFLFKSMQSGFEFSLRPEQEQELDKKLETERLANLQKYLEAEAILKRELPRFHASMTDFKYAYLSGDYGKFYSPDRDNQQDLVRLCNAMTRYLFYKTEMQHIENIQRAPSRGERNKVQLLQTKRNYSVDLLLQEGLEGEDRQEQIMQRAYLVFEEDYGNRCNLMQIKMFRSLMLGIEHEEGIDAIQARMGFGKTALLILLAIVKVALDRTKPEQDKHLVRYVVPRAVLEDNTNSFHQRLSSVLGGNVLQDKDFSRYQIDKKDSQASFKWILQDLRARLHFYQEARRRGDVLIQAPEIRCSMEAQDLDFGEMIQTGMNGDQDLLKACIEAKRLLVQIRSMATYTVFDELDDTQDFRSREVNFTRGDKTPIPRSTIRPLERVISYIEQHKADDWTNKAKRAEAMMKELCTDRDGNDILVCEPAVIQYLTQSGTPIPDEMKALLSEELADQLNAPHTLHTENDSMFLLIRMMLLDDYILSLIRSKQPSTHYGTRFVTDPLTGERRYFDDPDSHSKLLIAVPYEGTNTPKGLSVFDNTEVAAITTMRYYTSTETSFDIDPHLNFLITQLQHESIPQDLIEHYLPAPRGQVDHPAVRDLRNLCSLLDQDELRKAKERFYQTYMLRPDLNFRKFFAMAVVAAQVKADGACAKSDRYEQGSVNDIVVGCSGTVGDTSSYFTRQAPDPAIDGMMSIGIMARSNNLDIEWLSPPDPHQDYLKETIRTLLDHTRTDTRAIADIAGICKSKDGTPETVIQELWTQLKRRPDFASIQGIIYYGKDNVKRLYRGPGVLAVPCTTQMELAALKEKKYFSFYKQKNCRGSDVKQAHGIHCLVTMDENVSNSDAKQTILRLRGMMDPTSGQTFSFAAMPEYGDIVKARLRSEIQHSLKLVTDELAAVQLACTQSQQDLISKREHLKTHLEEKQKLTLNLKELKERKIALETQESSIRAKLAAFARTTLQAHHIANFLRLQEKDQEEASALTIFRKEMRAHVKVAAGHLEARLLSIFGNPMTDDQQRDYEQFLQERNRISSFVEHATLTLYKKYGTSTKDQARDAFIAEEKRRIRGALSALFKTASEIAGRHHQDLGSLKKDIYKTRIEQSIACFKARFSEHKTVQVSSTQTDGQNVAQAQAQALALALAEACNETLTESVVEAQQGLENLELTMFKDRLAPALLDFLRDATLLATVDSLPQISDAIRPTLRACFQLSPGIQRTRELSHYALANPTTNTYIFISHDEAEAFRHSETTTPGSLRPYVLYDIRHPEGLPNELDRAMQPLPGGDLTAAQLPCAIIGNNGIPVTYLALGTQELRATVLTNAESRQLLPSLSLQYSDGAVAPFYQPRVFGVTLDGQATLQLSSEATTNTVTISCGSGAPNILQLPRGNPLLTEHVQRIFGTGRPQKATQLQAAIQEIYDREARELQELQRQQAELAILVGQAQRSITGVPAFTLTETMKAGMRSRDEQFLPTGTFGRKPNAAYVQDVSAKTLAIFDEITTLQTRLVPGLPIQDAQRILGRLNELMQKLASANLLQRVQAINFNFEYIFTSDMWEQHKQLLANGSVSEAEKERQVPFLARLYGRLVFDVHESDLHGCRKCDRYDCNQTFTNLIPKLLEVIPKLKEAITILQGVGPRIQEIEDKIRVHQQKHKALLEAYAIANKLVEDEQALEQLFGRQGIMFNKGTFFDAFLFQHLIVLPDTSPPQHIVVTWKRPDYDLVRIRAPGKSNLQAYQAAFKALTREESRQEKSIKDFLTHVIRLSTNIEDRSTEITVV